MNRRDPPPFDAPPPQPLPAEDDLPRAFRRDPHVPLHPIGRATPGSARARGQPPAAAQRRADRFDGDDGRSGWKTALLVGLGLVGVLGAAAAAAVMLLHPADLVRERLIAEVKAKTGRDLAIRSVGALTLFPATGVAFTDVTLSAPPGMAGGPTISIERLETAVRFWPLLSRAVVVDRLVLKRPTIDLSVDAQGRRSWDLAAAAMPEQNPVRYAEAGAGAVRRDFAAAGAGATASGRRGLADRIENLTLNDIRVEGGTVRYSDARSGASETFENVDLALGLKALASPLEISGGAKWRGQPLAFEASAAPFRALLEGQRTKVEVSARSGDVVTASYTGTFADGDGPGPELQGKAVLKAPSLEALLALLGAQAAGGAKLGALDIETQLQIAPGRTALREAKAKLAGETIAGSFEVDTRAKRPRIVGDLSAGDLDLNRLENLARALQGIRFAAATSGARPAAAAAAPAAAAPSPRSIEDLLERPGAQVRGFAQRGAWSQDPISVAALAMVDADVKLAFARFAWREVKTGAGRGALAIKDGAARVTVDDLELYEGRARGVVTLDGTGGATLGATVIVEGADLRPLLADTAQFDWLAGKGRVTFALAARGANEQQLMDTLAGKADIAMGPGAVIGYDVADMLGGLRSGRLPNFERKPSARTAFTALTASTTIANGIATNQDFRLTSPQMTASGAGSVNLGQRQLDYTVRSKLGGAGVAQLELPVRIQGPWDKPATAIEGQVVLKNAGQAIEAFAKSEEGQKLQETIRGAIQGNPDAKAKARDFLRQLAPR